MQSLDETALQVISLMQDDARMSFVKMAETIGVTEGTVRRKVTQLLEDGIIKPTVIVNPYAIQYDAPALIGVQAEQKKSTKLAEEISKMKEVQFVALTTGPYEIMIQVVTRSNKDLTDFLLRLSDIEGIKGTNTFLILRIYKQTWQLKEAGRSTRNKKLGSLI